MITLGVKLGVEVLLGTGVKLAVAEASLPLVGMVVMLGVTLGVTLGVAVGVRVGVGVGELEG
jgi:hypothetical protein